MFTATSRIAALLIAVLVPLGASAQTLLQSPLASADGIEVVLSHVVLEPDQALPAHWHPGEEFAYIIEGSVTLQQEGKAPLLMKARSAAKIALRQVHSAQAGDSGATLVVFRVHESGQPERVLVEEP